MFYQPIEEKKKSAVVIRLIWTGPILRAHFDPFKIKTYNDLGYIIFAADKATHKRVYNENILINFNFHWMGVEKPDKSFSI